MAIRDEHDRRSDSTLTRGGAARLSTKRLVMVTGKGLPATLTLARER
jgi:hypothetical protein